MGLFTFYTAEAEAELKEMKSSAKEIQILTEKFNEKYSKYGTLVIEFKSKKDMRQDEVHG